MALVNPDMRFVRINQKLAEIIGVSIEDSIGKAVAEVVPDLWPAIGPVYRKVIQEQQPFRCQELRGQTMTSRGENESGMLTTTRFSIRPALSWA